MWLESSLFTLCGRVLFPLFRYIFSQGSVKRNVFHSHKRRIQNDIAKNTAAAPAKIGGLKNRRKLPITLDTHEKKSFVAKNVF